jgi:UDP-glucose 4-epimerase
LRVLVTGGAGFIGSHVAEAYLARGDEVALVDDLSSGRREKAPPRARLFTVDICEPALDRVFAEVKPELVNHHAAQISVPRSVAEPGFDIKVNILGTLNLLECCVRHGVSKVVFASTGGALYGELERNPADESHPVRPLSPYGIDKYAGEHYLRLFRLNHGLAYGILRYANVYGPRQDPHGEAGVVAIFSRAMLEGRAPKVFGDGEYQRDYVYVADVVEANLLLTDSEETGPFNIGTAKLTTTNQLYRRVAELTGFRLPPVRAPERPGEVRSVSLDAGLAAARLGWRPRTDLETGLRKTVEYFREEIRRERESSAGEGSQAGKRHDA